VASFVSSVFIAAVKDQLDKQMMKKLQELSNCVCVSQNAEEIPRSVGPEVSSSSS